MPLVATGERAAKFKHATSIVQISAPLHNFEPAHKVIVLLDDLHLFCQVWHYSALNYRTLNEHLRVDFILQDPYYPADPKPIPLALQRRMLLPFGVVKGLYEVDAQGYDDSLTAELGRRMAVPYDSVQQCLEKCAALMEEGDRESSAGHAESALELYVKAFAAIHIMIDGRGRRVLADHFFHTGVESGRYAGHSGTTCRIILRVNLVSRCVGVHLKLRQWEEAAFWGMRSIKIIQDGMGTEMEEFLLQFVARADVGLLFIRTYIAMKKMEEHNSEELALYQGDETANTANLYNIANRYMRELQELMKKELAEHQCQAPPDTGDIDSLAPMEPYDGDANLTTEGASDIQQVDTSLLNDN